MSMKDLLVCKFAGCNQVYNDPRILPCGKRTCAAHIEAMLVKSDNMNNQTKILKCHFCQKVHHLSENLEELPEDEYIPLLLNMKLCREHDAAKKSFNEVTQLLDKLIKLDKEAYVIDFFERVEADIVHEKEVNLQKLTAYYNKLVDGVHERSVKCLHNLKTNTTLNSELETIKQTLIGHESKLSKGNLDFVLKTMDGDEDKWKVIQSECNMLLAKIQALGVELNEKIVGDQITQFMSSTHAEHVLIDNLCGHMGAGKIDSTIVTNGKMKNDLVELCKLSGKEFKLIYRASRDGFEASSFHAKCDYQPRTLTIIKTTNGYVNKTLNFTYLGLSSWV